MLTSAPGEHRGPAQSCCSCLLRCVQGRVQGGGTAVLWGLCRSGCPALPRASSACPKGCWAKGTVPGVSPCLQDKPRVPAVWLCYVTCPCRVLVTEGTKQELFCREGQQVLRHNSNQVMPALLVTKKSLFHPSRVFTVIFLFVLKLVDFKSE